MQFAKLTMTMTLGQSCTLTKFSSEFVNCSTGLQHPLGPINHGWGWLHKSVAIDEWKSMPIDASSSLKLPLFHSNTLKCHGYNFRILFYVIAINRGWQSQAQKVTVVAFHKLLSQLLSEWLPFLFFSLFFCHFWWQQEWVGLLCISWPHLPQPDVWTPAISYRFKNGSGSVKLPAGQCRLLLPLNFYYIWGSSGNMILNCLWFSFFLSL